MYTIIPGQAPAKADVGGVPESIDKLAAILVANSEALKNSRIVAETERVNRANEKLSIFSNSRALATPEADMRSREVSTILDTSIGNMLRASTQRAYNRVRAEAVSRLSSAGLPEDMANTILTDIESRIVSSLSPSVERPRLLIARQDSPDGTGDYDVDESGKNINHSTWNPPPGHEEKYNAFVSSFTPYIRSSVDAYIPVVRDYLTNVITSKFLEDYRSFK